MRLANIIGPNAKYGIIPDLIKKLKKNNKQLIILGNGEQKKSYLFIDDCISAVLICSKKFRNFEVYNIGSDSWITVTQLSKIVCDEMGIKKIKFVYTSDKPIGWPGDISKFILDITKIKSLGWKQRFPLEEAIRLTVHSFK